MSTRAACETGPLGAACFFESEEAPFADLGINVRVLLPGRSTWLYHAEARQEAFLVVAGQCLLLVEGEERTLRAWDFVHCPPGTEHAFVAMGDEPCVVVMAGARGAEWPEHEIVSTVCLTSPRWPAGPIRPG